MSQPAAAHLVVVAAVVDDAAAANQPSAPYAPVPATAAALDTDHPPHDLIAAAPNALCSAAPCLGVAAVASSSCSVGPWADAAAYVAAVAVSAQLLP